jgi:hypothetical protein
VPTCAQESSLTYRTSTRSHTFFRFSGRVGGKTLARGSYRLVGVPKDAAGNTGGAQRTPFKIKAATKPSHRCSGRSGQPGDDGGGGGSGGCPG